jgi:hypothetical protein
VVAAHYCIRKDCSAYQYPGDYLAGNMGGILGVMLVLPGQIWTAAYPEGIQEWDAQDGHLMNSIPLTLDVGNFIDIQYDGKQVWASQMTNMSSQGGNYDLDYFVIDPVKAALVKKLTIQSVANDSSNDKEPYLFGVSPGKVWINHYWIDTDTFKITDVTKIFYIEPHFAYDGQGQMWITGDCDPLPESFRDKLDCDSKGLYIYDANNPGAKPKTVEKGNAPPDNYAKNPIAMAGGKAWMVSIKYEDGAYRWVLAAYQLNDPVNPIVHNTDINQHVPKLESDILMAADNKVIWIMADPGKDVLDYYDQADGHYMGSLHVGQLIYGMGFDGSSLWIMDNAHGLEQIVLPWAP